MQPILPLSPQIRSDLNAEQLAQQLREQFWSIEQFPVDSVAIARQLGINVVETELPKAVSGALIKEPGQDAKIVVDFADSDKRKRFNCAHQLGHYISRIESNLAADAYEYVDLRNQSPAAYNHREDIFANDFAAHLLIPSTVLQQQLDANASRLQLALYFGVANEAMGQRLSKLTAL